MEQAAREFFNSGYFQTFVEKAYPPEGARADAYPFFPIRRDRAIELCEDLVPDHVVDVGCGGGHLAEPFLLSGAAATGVDCSPRMLHWCRGRLEGLTVPPDRLRTIEAFASDMSGIDDGSADLVLCVGPLEYCSDSEAPKILSECARITRPGGTLITAHLNMLFDLFTLDRFTVDFYRRVLAPAFSMEEDKLDWIVAKMRDRLSLTDEPEKTESIREVVKTRTDNPLTVIEDFREHGLAIQGMRFVRFFAAPPFCGNEDRAIVDCTIPQEKDLSTGWVGYLAASSYLVKSIKAG